MTETLLSLIGGNSLSAALLFVAALVVQRLTVAPAIRHLAWAAVLGRLLVPPVLSVPLSVPWDGAMRNVALASLADPSSPEEAARPSGETPALPPPSTRLSSPDTRPLPGPGGSASPAGATTSPRSRRIDPRAVLAGIELTGVALFLTLALVRWSRFRRLLSRARPAPPALVARAGKLASRLGVTRVPRVLLTDARVSPLLVGGPGGAILLPERLLARLPAQATEAVLAHELAHVRRRDPWLRPLEMVASAIYWWFPLVPTARRRLRDAEEAACDALVVRALPHLRGAYARGLLETVEFLSGSSGSPSFATGAASARNLEERIVQILKRNASSSPLRRPVPRTALTIALAVVSLTPGWSRVNAAVREEPPVAPSAPVPPDPPGPMELPYPEIPELLEVPDAPVASLAPVPLALLAMGAPDGSPDPEEMLARRAAAREALRADLDSRRTELQLHRRLMEIEASRSELDRSLEAAQRRRELARLKADLELLRQSGEKEAEAEVRRARAELEHHIEIEEALGERQNALQTELTHLDLKMAELEMARDERRLEGDEAGAEAAEAEAEALQKRARELSLEQLRLEMERAEAELEAQRARYTELMRQFEAEDQAHDDAKAAAGDE